MAVQSVTSYTNAQANATRQAAETQQAQQQQKQVEERKQQKEEAPKPVVNAQGQQTGTLINVTA